MENSTMKIIPVFQQSPRRETRDKSTADANKEQRKQYTSLVVACAEEFIDIFSDACNHSFKSDIAAAIHHQRIEKVLQDVNIADMLSVESAHRIFKRCYGLRTWIYAPEEGVRGMIRESITMYYDPLKQILSDVHKITREACSISIEECQLMQAPGNEALKQLLEEQAYDAIDCWKTTTWDQLARNLHAEVEFPAPERFRSLRASIDRLLEHEAMMQAQRLVQHYQNMIEISMKGLSLAGKDIASMRRSELTSHAINPNMTKEPIAMDEFYMGWLEKRNRFGRWQRRWFVVSAARKKMWYFAHPEEQPARGAASLVGCAIYPDVVEEDSINELVFRLVFRQEGGETQDDSHQWLNMLTPGAPGKTKSGITSLTLRASTTSSKAEWMDMIGKAILGESIKPSADSTNVCNITAEIDGTAERKISTQVFPEDEEPAQEETAQKDPNEQKQDRRRPVRQSTKRTNTTIASFSISKEECDDNDDDDDEQTKEDSLLKELALFEEIAEQASQAVPSHEETIMLSCIADAVKHYMLDSQKLITEQASKIIADGMLPMLRKDELHTSLLKAILNPSDV